MTKLISRHQDDSLACHFGIEKTYKLLVPKYFWPSLRHNVEAYIKGCDVCLASKAVKYKPYSDFQSLPVATYRWKDLSMDFVTGLLILTDWKRDSYDSILVIIDWLTKMIHHKPVKIIIDAPGLIEVIIDGVVHHYSLHDSIVTNRGSLFNLKFWLSFCYFVGINCWLSTALHPQIDGQTKRQNSSMEAYLQAFVKFEQND